MSSHQPPTRIAVFCGSSPGASNTHTLAARALAESFHRHSIHLVYGGGTSGLMGEVARTLVTLSGKDAVTGVIPSSLLGIERPKDEDESHGNGKGKEKAKEKKLPRNWARRMGLPGTSGAAEKKGVKAETSTEKGKEKAKLLLDSEYGAVTIVPDLQARKRLMMELVRDGGPGSGFVALSGGIGTLDELFEVMSWGQMGVHAKGVCVLNVGGFWDGILQWIEKALEEKFVRERGEGRKVLGEVKEAGKVVGWLAEYDEGRRREREGKERGGL
ncbi:MAG: hypothetical protein Q9169_007689 [Polycauliona sp. 2 TL-2023]